MDEQNAQSVFAGQLMTSAGPGAPGGAALAEALREVAALSALRQKYLGAAAIDAALMEAGVTTSEVVRHIVDTMRDTQVSPSVRLAAAIQIISLIDRASRTAQVRSFLTWVSRVGPMRGSVGASVLAGVYETVSIPGAAGRSALEALQQAGRVIQDIKQQEQQIDHLGQQIEVTRDVVGDVPAEVEPEAAGQQGRRGEGSSGSLAEPAGDDQT